MENENEIIISPAERMYRSHLKNVCAYQRRNPEKMSEKAKRHYEKVRQDPEKNAEMLRKRREYFHNVVKPKKEALKILVV